MQTVPYALNLITKKTAHVHVCGSDQAIWSKGLVDQAGSLTGTNFTLGSYEKFQPGFRDEKRQKTSCGAKFEKQSKHGETQNHNFHTYKYIL